MGSPFFFVFQAVGMGSQPSMLSGARRERASFIRYFKAVLHRAPFSRCSGPPPCPRPETRRDVIHGSPSVEPLSAILATTWQDVGRRRAHLRRVDPVTPVALAHQPRRLYPPRNEKRAARRPPVCTCFSIRPACVPHMLPSKAFRRCRPLHHPAAGAAGHAELGAASHRLASTTSWSAVPQGPWPVPRSWRNRPGAARRRRCWPSPRWHR